MASAVPRKVKGFPAALKLATGDVMLVGVLGLN